MDHRTREGPGAGSTGAITRDGAGARCSSGSTVHPDDLLAAALAYARAAWPVFPCYWTTDAGCACGQLCESPGKHPLTHHGVKDAVVNEATIRWWWQRRPLANVAVATGAPAPDVIDVDTKDDRDGYASLGRLRRAGLLAGPIALVRTPSGGMHLYYVGSDQGNGSLRAHGVDFRASGGYVLAPPSVVDGRPYELVEHRAEGRPVDWSRIRAFLDPPRPATSSGGSSGTVHSDLDGLARWVEQQQAGNRNSGLYWASCRAAERGETDLSPLVAAAVRAGIPEGEAERTVASAQRRFGGAA